MPATRTPAKSRASFSSSSMEMKPFTTLLKTSTPTKAIRLLIETMNRIFVTGSGESSSTIIPRNSTLNIARTWSAVMERTAEAASSSASANAKCRATKVAPSSSNSPEAFRSSQQSNRLPVMWWHHRRYPSALSRCIGSSPARMNRGLPQTRKRAVGVQHPHPLLELLAAEVHGLVSARTDDQHRRRRDTALLDRQPRNGRRASAQEGDHPHSHGLRPAEHAGIMVYACSVHSCGSRSPWAPPVSAG